MSELVERIAATVVGRRREIELVVAALLADRHVVIEGPPGTGKSTLLRTIAHELGVGFEFVEGNAELTPARLVGHFDPARVLADGYEPDVFVDGPLATALRDGALLYVEEINRVPEETLNVLITVMSEGELHVPRLGRVVAAPGFRLVAAMNPFDAIGTARISGAVYDRVCRLAVDYQTAAEEAAIVRRTIDEQRSDRRAPDGHRSDGHGSDGHRSDADGSDGHRSDGNGSGGHRSDVHASGGHRFDDAWCSRVVELVRATREHPDVRIGSSVRGAIDMTAVAGSLAVVRGVGADDRDVSLDAALVALSGRIRLREACSRSAEDIVRELWQRAFGIDRPDETQGKATAPEGATIAR